jgi:uncharacterized protein YjiS (DUF1127 family)
LLAYIYDDLLDVDWRGLVACHGSAAVIPEAREVMRRAYREWRRARDVERIAHVLGQLSDRQLRLIGMSRVNLFMDIEALVARNDVLREYAAIFGDPAPQLAYRTPRAELPPPATAGSAG